MPMWPYATLTLDLPVCFNQGAEAGGRAPPNCPESPLKFNGIEVPGTPASNLEDDNAEHRDLVYYLSISSRAMEHQVSRFAAAVPCLMVA